jgi:hypothetical protein
LERPNEEVQRRAEVVGIFPSEQAQNGLLGAVPLAADDEWQRQQRSMPVEAMAGPAPRPIAGETTPSQPADISPQAA